MVERRVRSEEDKDCNQDDEGSKSTSSEEPETEEPTKSPAKPHALTQPSKDDIDDGKEGMADGDDSAPCNVEIVRYARKIIVHLKGSTMNVLQNVQPAKLLELQGTLAPPEIASARPCMLKHTGPLSPGRFFPWAWPMTMLMPLWTSKVIIPLIP